MQLFFLEPNCQMSNQLQDDYDYDGETSLKKASGVAYRTSGHLETATDVACVLCVLCYYRNNYVLIFIHFLLFQYLSLNIISVFIVGRVFHIITGHLYYSCVCVCVVYHTSKIFIVPYRFFWYTWITGYFFNNLEKFSLTIVSYILYIPYFADQKDGNTSERIWFRVSFEKYIFI